jgi:hypothetical protein
VRIFFAAGLALTLLATSAAADEAVLEARAAYDRGAAAYDAHDYAHAAVDLARADELAPNGTVLDLALQAAIRAEDAALVMELVERVEVRVPASTPSPASMPLFVRAREARAKFSGLVGRVLVRCPPPAVFCTASLDGRSIGIDAPRYAMPGDHVVALETDGASEKQIAHVQVGQVAEVKPTPPVSKVAPPPDPPKPANGLFPSNRDWLPPLPPEHPNQRHGISPAWFWISGAATVVAGGVTIASAIDTKNEHDHFVSAPSASTQSSGQSAQLRTNILLGVTGGLAALTTVVGVFFVGWSQGPSVTVAGRY